MSQETPISTSDPAQGLKGSVELQTLIRDDQVCRGVRAGYDDIKKLMEQCQRDTSRDKSEDGDARLHKIEAIAEFLDIALAFKMRADFIDAGKAPSNLK